MKMMPALRQFSAVFALVAFLLLPGCALFEGRKDPQVVRSKEQYTAFRSQPGWRKKTYRDEKLMAKAAEGNASVEIALREQRGLLLVNKAIAMDFPVATGRSSHPTPKGSYKILEKKKDYKSNLYGRIVSGDGGTLVSDADTRENAVPEGAQFVGAAMPYWMRMTTTGLGMHVGYVPGHRPASHGCVRLKRETATELFALLPVGTPVTIDSFAPALGGPVGVDSVVIGEFADPPPRRVSAPNPVASPSPTPPSVAGATPAAQVPAANTAPISDPLVVSQASPVSQAPVAAPESVPSAPSPAASPTNGF